MSPSQSFRSRGFKDNAKTRLASELPLGPRKALVEAMYTDVLTALRRTRSIDTILVVSSDHNAQQIAGGHGAGIVEDSAVGHSNAAAAGIAAALELGHTRVLLVPGDTPLLDPTELEELLGLPASARSALIIPDRHGDGTNALLLSPPDALTPSFGEGSAERHHQLAAGAGHRRPHRHRPITGPRRRHARRLRHLAGDARQHPRRSRPHARHAQQLLRSRG